MANALSTHSPSSLLISSLLVYNKKGFPFVSDYKRDIFDKYTVIYWIQESYDLIFVFFRGDAFIRRDKMSFFAKKIAELFAIPNLFVSLHPQTKIIGLWCNGNTTDSGPVIPGSNPGSPTKHQLFTDKNPLKMQF